MWDLGLSVFLALSGVSVVDSPRDCRDQPGLMGGYITGTNLIELCHANVHRADQDLERVLISTRWCMPLRKISIFGSR